MSRRNTRSQAAVESLLDERRQYQEWLEKLALPGAAGAPSPVVERVRADYQTRLDNVTRQLGRHEGELETALVEAQARRDLAAGQRTARQDALTEAVLRHEVGEYDDEKFEALNAEHTSFLAQHAEEIESADREITRLEEVLALIARVLPEPAPPPSAPATSIAAAAPSAPVAPSAPAAPSASDVATAPAAAVPLATAEALGKVASRLSGLDELSFLRAVAGGASPGPAAPPGTAAPAAAAPASPAPESPSSGAAPATPGPAPEPTRASRVSRPVLPPAAVASPAPPPLAVPAPAAPVGLESRPARAPSPEPPREPQPERAPEAPQDDAALPMPVHHIFPEHNEARTSSARVSKKGTSSAAEAADDAARKSLRCTECGTLNHPTEWYCEKCGAELSAF